MIHLFRHRKTVWTCPAGDFAEGKRQAARRGVLRSVALLHVLQRGHVQTALQHHPSLPLCTLHLYGLSMQTGQVSGLMRIFQILADACAYMPIAQQLSGSVLPQLSGIETQACNSRPHQILTAQTHVKLMRNTHE